MMETPPAIEDAAARLQAARARFYATLGQVRTDLAPKAVIARTRKQARDSAEAKIRAHPYAATGAAAALFLLIFRKPIAGLVRRIFRTARHD